MSEGLVGGRAAMRLREWVADLTLLSRDGVTPLAWAIFGGHREIIDLLVRAGAHLSTRGSLADAVARGEDERARRLLEEGAAADSGTEAGLTPLHCAAGSGNGEMVELFVARGADVNARADARWTPLGCAARRGDPDMVSALLSSGADPNSGQQWEETPLTWAAMRGRHMIIPILAEAGADLDARGGPVLGTALYYAAERHDDVGTVDALLKAGADPNFPNDLGQTPLHAAALHRSVNLARLLVTAGARILADEDGFTPLHAAISSDGDVDILAVLHEAGADVNAQGRGGRRCSTPPGRRTGTCEVATGTRGRS